MRRARMLSIWPPSLYCPVEEVYPMKAQLSIEFLLLFLLALLFVHILSYALLSERSEAMLLEDDARAIARAGDGARAVEAWSNSGMEMDFDLEDQGLSFRVQGDKLMIDHEGKVIEIGGIYSGSDIEAE